MKLEKILKNSVLGINLNFELLTLYSIYLLAVLVPVLIGQPQLLIGSIINFLIVFTVLQYGIKKSMPVLALPSISATAYGMLFAGATYFLIFLMPFIIVSNYILAYFVSKRNIYLSILGILFKGMFLYVVYRLMIEYFGLPTLFITSSYLQFVTASIGVLLGYSLYFVSKK